MKFAAFVTGLLLATALAGPSHAQENCRLDLYSEIPITTLPDGRFTVPVILDDRPLNFMVDTGGVTATIDNAQAFNMGLRILPTGAALVGVAGSTLSTFATIGTFSLGRLKGKNIPVYIDNRMSLNVDGTLSSDMMKHFDVDIDLMRGTLSLFSQKHCPGKVVHWTQSGYVALPMRVLPNGHIEVPVTIDGRKFMALLDTGARNSIVSMRTAKKLGIAENSPDLKLVTDKDAQYKRYDYPFKLLDFDGVAVSKPRLQIVSDNYLPRDIDLIVGVSILRRLHLYIAYGEEKLYITPATAN
jgi:predicted aspartyl protease